VAVIGRWLTKCIDFASQSDYEGGDFTTLTFYEVKTDEKK
jgi:hypothetical protein